MELSAWSSYGLLSLLGGLANLLLGTVILAIDPRNKLNRLYALCTYSIAWWGFMKVGVANSITLESAGLHYQLSAIGWCLLPAFYVHFGAVFVEKAHLPWRKVMFACCYTMAVTLFLLLWVPNVMLVEMFHEWWGITDRPGWAFRFVFQPFFFGCFIWVIADLWCFAREHGAGDQRARALMVLAGLAVPLFGGAITNMILPSLEIYVYELAVPLTTLNALIVAFAMYRYRFLTITVELAASGIIDTMGDSLIVLGPSNRIRLVNPATLELLGFAEDQVLGKHINEILYDEAFDEVFGSRVGGTVKVRRDVDYLGRDKKPIAVSLSVATLMDRKGNALGYVCVGKDIRELKRLIAEIETAKSEVEQLAVTDELTGLYNRRFLTLKMKEEFLRSQRFEHPFSIIIVDLDRFKEVNDRFGHDQGDRVLRLVAGALPPAVRSIDTVARYGGDEFVVLLPETPRDQAIEVADRIRENMASDLLPEEYRFVTASLGVSTFDPSEPGPDESELFRLADWALLQAKRSGRNRVIHAAENTEERGER